MHQYWLFLECMAYFILELVYHHDNEYIGIIIAIVVWTPWEDAKNLLVTSVVHTIYLPVWHMKEITQLWVNVWWIK